MTVSTLQRDIYNAYLKIIAKQSGRGFRPRKDFSKITKERFAQLEIIERFVETHNVHLDTFFEIPFIQAKKRGEDIKYYSLDFYTTFRAKTMYGKFLINKANDLDGKISIQFLKTEIYFIVDHCKLNNINLNQYLNQKDGMNYVWYDHIARKDITKELVIALMDSYEKFHENEEASTLLLGQNYKKILSTCYTSYIKSTKYKKIIKAIKEKYCN
tara:strand:+ start:42555 stop:43196 length:642 start_codon:yes stop_codon:yes gene_type:complete